MGWPFESEWSLDVSCFKIEPTCIADCLAVWGASPKRGPSGSTIATWVIRYLKSIIGSPEARLHICPVGAISGPVSSAEVETDPSTCDCCGSIAAPFGVLTLVPEIPGAVVPNSSCAVCSRLTSEPCRSWFCTDRVVWFGELLWRLGGEVPCTLRGVNSEREGEGATELGIAAAAEFVARVPKGGELSGGMVATVSEVEEFMAGHTI